MWGFITDFFTYETSKSVVVKSWSVGIINRFIQLLIIVYFVCWVFLHEKAYQIRDSSLESAVMTKVKGYGRHNNRVMDVADYVSPPQGSSVFAIFTAIIITENQTQGTCEDNDKKSSCTTDADCKKLLRKTAFANGILTGTCLNSTGKCEIEGWCPTENDTPLNETIKEVENFTIFIKNSVRFPLFNVTRGNFPASINESYIKTCRYHPVDHPYCPIFRVGDVLEFTNQDFDSISMTGGEIGINIGWTCNFDEPEENCNPSYSFTRLDSVFEHSDVSKGYNFRFAKYYKRDEVDYRTLHKAHAIRFDILVSGNAGKFNVVPTLINIVAAFTSVGLATVLCDIFLLNFHKGADQYKAKKFEEVSQLEIEHEQNMSACDGQLSIKPQLKHSEDSGVSIEQQV